MEHLTLEQLNDYVDDRLTSVEREIVARHTADCEDCRREIAAYRRVIARLGGLPPDFAPPPAVWAGVAADTRRRHRLTMLARAAAILLMVGGAALFTTLIRRPDRIADRDPADTTTVDPGSLATELAQAYAARRAALPPEAARAVDRSLKTLDGVIADTQAALDRYPDDPRLGGRLKRAEHLRLRMMAEAINWSSAPQGGGI